MSDQSDDNLLADFQDHITFAHANRTTVRTVNRYRNQGLPWIRWNGRVLIGPAHEAREWVLSRVNRTRGAAR